MRIAAPINTTPAIHVASRSKPVIGSVAPVLCVELGVVDPVLDVVLAGVVVVAGVVEVVVVALASTTIVPCIHGWIVQM